MSISGLAAQVQSFLWDRGFEYAAPDARGGTFDGGILMDLGGYQRMAFFMPTDAEGTDAAEKSLVVYLEDIYPGKHDVTGVHIVDGLHFAWVSVYGG